MLIVRNIKLPIDTELSVLQSVIEKKLNIKVRSVRLYKRSVDARNKDSIFFNCAVLLETDNDAVMLKRLKRFDAELFHAVPYVFQKAGKPDKRPIVVGFGPAGMFCALALAKAGLCPIVLERGRDVDSRTADVERFFKTNELDENSNIQFGEGGAGTFSDGKLNTGIKDPRIRAVLETFVRHGADECILYDAKPHIGTDVLVNVVKSVRQEITALGGEVLFCHRLVDLKLGGGKIKKVVAETTNGLREFECDRLSLCIGHSARDTFELLKKKGFLLEPKPFAVGARIEHSQDFIDRVQYGKFAGHPNLGAADYKLAVHLANGRGVYTFCMCPGGEVVNASSEKGMVAVNGMSYNARNGGNANSAVLCEVRVDDYFKGDVLDGMYFQREIERKAFEVGLGLPISQSVGQLLGTAKPDGSVKPSVKSGSTFGDLSDCLPLFVTDALKEGLPMLDRKLKGFADTNAILTGPETRSSSPIRIVRNGDGEASFTGVYSVGEGAGYAGGITSAAVDGLKAAEKIISVLNGN